MDKSIAAQSAKLESLAPGSEVVSSKKEGTFGCSGNDEKVNGFMKQHEPRVKTQRSCNCHNLSSSTSEVSPQQAGIRPDGRSQGFSLRIQCQQKQINKESQ
ncbi:hypothetical protein BZZ01_30360 [Nostocales cyanobacterium HT-58-2]|nr:hypothetical protein BZZ01_30360 [Nostocales cyanobacterium HT-58-2]